jgi:Zn-dependent M28 family amino/carboxypeptidase
LFSLLFAQETADQVEEGLKTIHHERIKGYISYLASDELEGRAAGTKGNRKGAKYIASHFKELELKPAGRRSFFQKVRAKVKNVLALYESSDPELKDEVIVVGAHFDHLGKGSGVGVEGRAAQSGRARDLPTARDKIWNGADDNASGTAAMMEIARAFSRSKIKTKRSILFIGFNAEETKYEGSKYYLKHRLKLKHIAMINLDMVGRNPDEPVLISGIGTSDLWRGVLKRSSEKVALKIALRRIPEADSDHTPFIQEKIPAIFVHTGLHEEFHTLYDHAELIDAERIAKICKCIFLVLYELANLERPPSWRGVKVTPKELGIAVEKIPEEGLKGLGLESDRGALRVTDILEGSIAQKGGLG